MNEQEEALSPRMAAAALGVSTASLLAWERKGYIVSQRTAGGHRRYSLAEIERAQVEGGRRAEALREKRIERMREVREMRPQAEAEESAKDE